MYKVVYYMSAGNRASKTFETISEALQYSVYKITAYQLYEIYKI